MRRRIQLVLPYPPSVNRWKDPHAGGAHLSGEVRRYKAAAESLLRRHLGKTQLLEGDVRMTLHLFRPLRAGDISNRIKVLEDCLRGLVFVDDVQVAELNVRRSEDRSAPRVHVTLEEVDATFFVAEAPDAAMLRDAIEVGRMLASARLAETQRKKGRRAVSKASLRGMATKATYSRVPK